MMLIKGHFTPFFLSGICVFGENVNDRLEHWKPLAQVKSICCMCLRCTEGLSFVCLAMQILTSSSPPTQPHKHVLHALNHSITCLHICECTQIMTDPHIFTTLCLIRSECRVKFYIATCEEFSPRVTRCNLKRLLIFIINFVVDEASNRIILVSFAYLQIRLQSAN